MAPSSRELEDLLRDILRELKAHRAAIVELQGATWLAYAQEIGRSTVAGGMRLDVILVLGAAGATGLLGVQGETLIRVLAALAPQVGP
jgi:hypothetical protein